MALPPVTSRAAQAPATPEASHAADAARRAFFQAALAKTGAPAAAAPQGRVPAPPVTALKDERLVPQHPGRILRPGSLIDIKV